MNTGTLLLLLALVALAAAFGAAWLVQRREATRLAAEKQAAEAARDKAENDLRTLAAQRTETEKELAALRASTAAEIAALREQLAALDK